MYVILSGLIEETSPQSLFFFFPGQPYHLGNSDSRVTSPCLISCPWLEDWTSFFPKDGVHAGPAH